MHQKEIKLGLKENWKQFTLLVIINAFVGGMVGLERSILPQIAEKEFAIAASTTNSPNIKILYNTWLPTLLMVILNGSAIYSMMTQRRSMLVG